MRWESEIWRKLYIRDTHTWRRWGWQARCLFPLLLRAVDRAGLWECSSVEEAPADLAAYVGVPEDLAIEGLSQMQSTGTISVTPTTEGAVVRIVKFLDAQEARMSEGLRSKLRRELDKMILNLIPNQTTTRDHSRPLVTAHDRSRPEKKRREKKRTDRSNDTRVPDRSVTYETIDTGGDRGGDEAPPHARPDGPRGENKEDTGWEEVDIPGVPRRLPGILARSEHLVDARDLCIELIYFLRQQSPGCRVPDPRRLPLGWLRPMEALLRLDRRAPDDVYQVLRWATQDDFWAPNIRSPGKLRKQYDRLLLLMRRQIERGQYQTPATAPRVAEEIWPPKREEEP